MNYVSSMTYVTSLLLLFSHCSAISKLIDTAVNISNTYYDHHFATTVIWKQNNSNCVNEFLKNYSGTVVLSPWQRDDDSNIHNINETIGFRQTIYFSTSLHDYTKFMKLLNEVIRFPVRFIIVLENPVKTSSELSDFMEVSSKNDQADLVIISANYADEVTLSTFFPYSDGLCGNYTPVLLQIGNDMFPKKFSNFYQCPIRVSLIEFLPFVKVELVKNKIISIRGYDGEILMILLKKLNASLEAIGDKYGAFTNRTLSGSISDLVTERADMLVPGGLLNSKRFSLTLPSHIYHTKDIRWVGRKQQEVYDYFKFIVPDRTNFTPIHGLTFVLFLIVAMIVRKCKSHLTGTKNHVLYQSFVILLGQSVKFVTKSKLLNSLFILWIWFCFIFRIDYQADLVEALQRVELEPPLESIETALTRVDGYGGPEIFLEYYRGTPLEHTYKILPLHEYNEYVPNICEGENFLIATDITLVQQLSRCVQILGKRISMSGTCFFMRPGWPAMKDVDDVIFSLVETGFIEKLYSSNEFKWVFNGKLNTDNGPHSLSMTKLWACFCGLAIMWIICIFVLIIEIMYYRINIKKTPIGRIQ